MRWAEEERAPLRLFGALAFDGLEAARVELEQGGDLIVRPVGRGRHETGRPACGASNTGRGGDELQQVESDVFVAASGAGQCGGLLHFGSPMAVLTDWAGRPGALRLRRVCAIRFLWSVIAEVVA